MVPVKGNAGCKSLPGYCVHIQACVGVNVFCVCVCVCLVHLFQVTFQGTVVNIENFLAWKARFELEVAEIRQKRQKDEEQAGKLKLTGKHSDYAAASAVTLNANLKCLKMYKE